MPSRVQLSYQTLRIYKRKIQELGLYFSVTPSIHIRRGLSLHEEGNTLLHELLHAICYCSSVGLSRAKEEQVVSALSNGLTEVMLRNPKLRAYFMEAWANPSTGDKTGVKSPTP